MVALAVGFGKPVILDSKEPDTLRDDAGKVVARRSGPDKLVTSLAERAAFWISERPVLMDLRPSDVVAPNAARASFGISTDDFVADIANLFAW